MKREVENLKKQYLIMVNKITTAALDLLKKGRTKAQVLESLSDPSFKNTILNDSAFKQSRDDLNSLYSTTLRSMDKFGDINPNTLLAITRLNKASFFDRLDNDFVTSVQSKLADGIVGGLPKAQIIDSITSELRPDQIETLVTTGINTYIASVNSIMADTLPENTAYVYRGPIDEKTRPICLALMSRGEVTKKQIDKEFPGAFLNRGGYNCRHQWSVSTTKNPMHFPTEARSEAKDRGIAIG